MVAPLVLLGCGSSGSVPPTVSLSVTVPVDGVTVRAPVLDVVGTVTPGAALVRVGRTRVPVRGGQFSQTLQLHAGVNRIHIFAAASGYGHTRSELTVRYRAGHHPAGISQVAAFTNRVNDVCSAEAVQISVMPAITDLQQAQADVPHLLALDEESAAQLEALHAPGALAGSYDAFVATVHGMVDAEQELIRAVRTKSLPGLERSLGQLQSLARRMAHQANSMRLEQCIGITPPSG